jgi:alanine racemase
VQARTTRPRIEDVARAAGVSKTAVSFAFNTPDRLSAETAERILDVAAALGYRPHPVARVLAQGRTMTLGVLTPQPLGVMFSNPFFATFGEGVAEVAEAHGYGLQFISPLRGSLALALGRSTVDGVVAVGLSADHPELEQIRRAGVPTVLVDADDQPGHPSVVVDDEAGARSAAEHLLALGHRDVLVLAVEEAAPSTGGGRPDGVSARRLRGYRAAFEAAGVALPDTRVVATRTSIDGGSSAFRACWSRGDRPTAVLAMSDATAVGTMRAARELGLAIPGDLSVVGFDDVDLAAHVDPPLTTVHQPGRRKGAEAVRLLLAALDDPSRAAPAAAEHVALPTRLVVRSSTGPVPPAGDGHLR